MQSYGNWSRHGHFCCFQDLNRYRLETPLTFKYIHDSKILNICDEKCITEEFSNLVYCQSVNHMSINVFPKLFRDHKHPGGGGGYSQKNWVGVCGPLPKTLTLFMTKICDFPYPIYDLTKNLIPYL